MRFGISIDRKAIPFYCAFPETWFADAEKMRDLIESRFEWHEEIKLVIRWERGNAHMLSLLMFSRGKRFGVSCDLTNWLKLREQAQFELIGDHYIAAAFDQLVRAAMYEVRS